MKINASKEVEKLEPLCTVVWNLKWCGNMKTAWQLPKKLKTELRYDSVVQFLGIY